LAIDRLMTASTSPQRVGHRAGAEGFRRGGPKILIAGLGNLILGDDGVGVHAVRRIKSDAPRGVTVVEVGTAVMDALHLLEKADKVLVIDALQAGGVPGTVYAARVADLDNRGVQASLHELNLLAALHFLKRWPEILILGVEPETIQLGMTLSPRVEAAIPELIRHVLEAVGRWRRVPLLVHNSRHGPKRKRTSTGPKASRPVRRRLPA